MKKLLSLFAFLLVSNAVWAADNKPKKPEYRLALEGEYEPAKSAVDQTKCIICHEDFCDNLKDVCDKKTYNAYKKLKFLSCDRRHNKFHKKCADGWLAQKNNCPVCKNFEPARNATALKLLINALQKKDLEAVQALIDGSTDLNAQDGDGHTALMLAMIISQPNIIQALIDGGADVDLKDNRGKTALMLAIIKSRPRDVIQALIDGGADVDLQDNTGHTALMLAVMRSQPRNIIQALIDGGTNLDLTDNWGRTALMLAIAKKNIPAVQLLFNKTTNYDETTRQQALGLLKENVREADV